MASSTSTTSSDLTFGLEIEAIVAFHQRKLEQHLSANFPGASIIKILDGNQELALREDPTRPYNSWVLTNTGDEGKYQVKEIDNDGKTMVMNTVPFTDHPSGRVRAYRDEPLYIVQELLTSTNAAPNIIVHNPIDHNKPTEYTSWMLTSDHTLISLAPEEKKAVIKAGEADEWDTSGIELVSPPYLSITQARTDIASIFDAIKTTVETSLTTNTHCGLHVHIGQESDKCLPLRALQHLAYLLIVYEDEISRLHPGHRRRGEVDPETEVTELGSNRCEFYRIDEPAVARQFTDPITSMITTRMYEPTYRSLETIRKCLFEEVDDANDSIGLLQSHMVDNKGRYVNFTYLNRRNGPQTIEFRQHAATIDADEITWWVKFCMGLVELAMRFYKTGEGCSVRDWDDKIHIDDLLEEMDFPVEGREYYREKIERYARDLTEGQKPFSLWMEVESTDESDDDETYDDDDDDGNANDQNEDEPKYTDRKRSNTNDSGAKCWGSESFHHQQKATLFLSSLLPK